MNSLRTWIGLWVIAVLLSSYIRLYPLRAHIWDPTYDKASLMVVYQAKNTLLKQILAQSPQIPPAMAEHLATQKLNEALRKDGPQMQSAIEKVNRQMFQASGAKPNIYLLESDPYYFYYLTENIVKTGKMAETVKGSKYFEPLMTAPFGFWQPMTYHPYVGTIVYQILKLFNPDISLMASVAYTPLILMALVLAAFFLLCYTLEISALASFAAGLAFVMTPVILKRSSLGWYDTDPYNLLFPLLLLTVLLKAFNYKNIKDLVRYAFLFALTIAAFAAIWQGWGFMLAISLAIVAVSGVYAWLLNRSASTLRPYVILGTTLAAAALAGISCLFGFGDFFRLLQEGSKELEKFTVKGLSLWPNLFMEVGELKKFSLADLISDSGGWMFLLAGGLSVFYCLWHILKDSRREYVLRMIALGTFLFACAFLTIGAERFSIFALMGLSLFLAAGVDAVLNKLSAPKKPWLAWIMCAALTLFIFINAQKNIRTSLTPIFNSAWETALVNIRNNTPEDSIINCWWPPGHFIKGIARRHVMFDGATLSESATGYWMANILLSENEDQAAGLLRMLNLSGNKGVDFLVARGLKTSEAVALLTTIASRSDAQALAMTEAVLKNREAAHQLLTIIRGGTPHSYVLLYNDLVEQNLGLAFMGRWNIKRVEQINENSSLLSSVPARNGAGYIDFLWSLAGGQPHYSPALQFLGQNDKGLSFAENLLVDKNTMMAAIQSSTYGQGTLASVVYVDNGRIIEKVNPQATLKYSVVLYTLEGRPMARLMDRNLANSILIKLFFLNAEGMAHFKPFTASSDMTGRTQIKVFEANWN